MLFRSPDALQVREVEAAVADPGCGAVLTFVGTARRSAAFGAREVLALDYEAYVPMALAELAKIREEAMTQWPGIRLAMVHRTGRVAVGEVAVVVSVSSPHRAEAYEASRFSIEQLKARVPIWKKECYTDGADWTTNRP